MTVIERRSSHDADRGVTIENLDLERDLDESLEAELRVLLRAHGVLIFRDQANLSPQGQVRFARAFGQVYPVSSNMPSVGAEAPEVMVFDERFPIETAGWHSDGTPDPAPPYCTTLRGVSIPPSGGDTVWSSMYAAYDALSDRMQQYLVGLTCVHSVANAPEQYLLSLDPATRDKTVMMNTVHPIVIANAETGRRALFVNKRYSTRVLELPLHESETTLQFLFAHIMSPDFQTRLVWEPDTVAVWDNIFTQHSPTGGYRPGERVMHRVAVRSPEPVFVAA